MDQGTAGVIAGIVGAGGALIGTAVGAMASIRGARIGGAKAVEAALTQVERQADVEQHRWVQGQRQQACMKFLDAHSAAEDALNRAALAIQGGERFPDAARDAFSNHVRAMQACTSQLALWGPEEVVSSAQNLRIETSQAAKALVEAERDASWTQDDFRRRWAHWLQASGTALDFRTNFLQVAGRVLRDPHIDALGGAARNTGDPS
ncbi:hypothetical protein GCM10009612_72320 [Streptomyces beijiangensis]